MLFSDEEKEDVFMMKEGYKFSGWLGGGGGINLVASLINNFWGGYLMIGPLF